MGDLTFDANEIRDSLGDHVKNTEKIETNMEEKYGQEAVKETKLPVLKQDLKKTKEKADEMTMKAEKTEKRIARLEESLHQMQKQLDKTQNDLREMEGNLHTGQTAYNFEKHLAAYIYPPGTPMTHDRIFTTLMKWLKAHKHTREGRNASRKWEELKKEFGWSNDKQQTAVFFKMLKCREEYAHPEVNFALPIPENFSDSEKKCVQVIRNMTIKLNEHVNRYQHDI